MSYGTCLRLSGCLPGSSWIPLTPFDALHRIRQQRVFISSLRVFLLCSMYCTLSSTVCVQTLPTEQATPALTDFFFAGS